MRNGLVTKVAPMILPRTDFAAVVSGNYIVVFGGWQEMSSCEKYNPTEDRFVRFKGSFPISLCKIT